MSLHSGQQDKHYQPLRRPRTYTQPSLALLEEIPVAYVREFQLSKKEIEKLRRRLYGINKDGIRRYRTLIDYDMVLVWRLK